jgi:hypothetical protein
VIDPQSAPLAVPGVQATDQFTPWLPGSLLSVAAKLTVCDNDTETGGANCPLANVIAETEAALVEPPHPDENNRAAITAINSNIVPASKQRDFLSGQGIELVLYLVMILDLAHCFIWAAEDPAAFVAFGFLGVVSTVGITQEVSGIRCP